MATITLYCRETPGLKLGPDSQIVFVDGYADVDTDALPDWAAWAFHSGSPFIRVLDADEATSAIADGAECPTCGKVLKNQKALNGHLLSHRRK